MLTMEKAVTAAELPGALFFGAAALAEHGENAAAYETAIVDYERHGEECTLWHMLAGLGFDDVEIGWHLSHCGERMRQGYCA